MKRARRLDLQTKISLVLVTVILSTFLVVTIAENKLTQPILEEEMREIGITSGQTLAADIVSSRLLSLQNPTPAIENRIQDFLYSQPNIVRIDVTERDPATGQPKMVGSNIEEDPDSPPTVFPVVDSVTAEYKKDDSGMKIWEINVPIERKSRDPRGPRRLLGSVHVVVTMRLVGEMARTFWKTTAAAAAVSVVTLIFMLGYFLRKTIANDKLLRQAEDQNLQLTEQLHETERQLMNTEKMAVMGQLTASFAHEIGTPLNAIGGHLHLLKEELDLPARPTLGERLDVINGQLLKIESIVKGFLQSTSKPVSQKQLVDVNRLVEKALGIVRPRIEAQNVEIIRRFNREMGPVRAVPLDLEQIFLNLMTNSLDSLKAKADGNTKTKLALEISTRIAEAEGKWWAQIVVYDTGGGIKKSDLKNVLKPFFTTKRPGEGTGLGLTICQQLAHKQGGQLEIDSKEGSWTKVTLRIPYQVSA